MAKDLTIRILGRPQVTKDDQVGYQRIARQYVVEGYRASYSGINDATNPLFLAVGTEDEEFEGHYLVNQKITPKQGSVDVAYLTREFVEIRDTWSSESFSQSRGFKKISRQFVCLRAAHPLGYSEENFNKHPHNNPDKNSTPGSYTPIVVASSTPLVSEQFNIPVNVEFNHKWHPSTFAVDTKTPGIDVWSVAWTSPIRPEGEPSITKDTQVGNQTVSRAYVIRGDYYNKNKLFDVDNPLFLPVGTEDHEYTNHYLIDQSVKPRLNMQNDADDTVEDLGIIVRTFVEIRNTWVSESISASNDLKRIRRNFVVLRAEHPKGYSASLWPKHPSQGGQVDPWSYAPDVVTQAPTPIAYTYPTTSPLNKNPQLDDASLIDNLIKVSGEINSGAWIKGSAQVSSSKPGVDVWSVEWVTHTKPYWSSAGEKTTGSSSFKSPVAVTFNTDGVQILNTGGSGSGSTVGQAANFTFFAVSESVSTTLSSYWKGVSSSQPSVMLDFYLQPKVGGSPITFKQQLNNAVFNSTGTTNIGGLATSSGVVNGYRFFGGYYNGDQEISELPKFKNIPISDGGGIITFSHDAITESDTTSSPLTVKTNPVFTSPDPYESSRIWRIVISYVG
jgi:hypothetical protein